MIEDIFLKDFLEIFVDGIFIIDLKGNLIEVNKNFTDLLRDQRKELIGKNIMDVFSFNASELSGKSHMPLMVKLESEGYVKDQEIQYARKDAAVLFAKLNIKSIVDSRGKTTNYIGSVHDITEQKVWKQKTEEKEAFLRKIIHADPNLVFVKHRNGKYVEVSEGLAKL
jgi:PAS domain S-box-containing protein